jgi:hypothetical protein
MWRLIKAELIYNRLYLVLSCLGSLGLWLLVRAQRLSVAGIPSRRSP